jgi:hypothetical protein
MWESYVMSKLLTGIADTSHDEELALRLMQSDLLEDDPVLVEDDDSDLIPTFADPHRIPTGPVLPFARRHPFYPNADSRPVAMNPDPFAQMNAIFNRILPPDHPINLSMQEMMHGPFPRNQYSRRIVFPESFRELEGADDLPLQLRLMMRGEEDTNYEVQSCYSYVMCYRDYFSYQNFCNLFQEEQQKIKLNHYQQQRLQRSQTISMTMNLERHLVVFVYRSMKMETR